MAWDIAARFGPYGEPAVIVDYGDSGLGKTTGMLRSLPATYWMNRPGGLKPAISRCGYTPRHSDVETLWDCFRVLEQLYKECDGDLSRLWANFDGIGIDDLSVILESTAKHIKKQYSGWDVWTTLLDLVIEFRDIIRQQLGLHFLITAHEMPPGVDMKTGQRFMGGPEMPSKKHVRKLAHVADVTVRSAKEPGRLPHSGVWLCDPDDPDYHYKDRHSIAIKRGPMNAGELLREAGYPLRRLPGCEWFDDMAEEIAQGVMQKEGEPDLAAWRVEVMRRVSGRLRADGVCDNHLLWVAQDGLDRAEFRMGRRSDVNRRLGLAGGDSSGAAGGLKL